MAVNYPGAISVPYTSAGSFATGFPPRIVHHTTEGVSLPHYVGSAPHLTVDIQRRKVYQHIPLDQAAKALIGSALAGIETNFARAIQVEWIGFSDTRLADRLDKPGFAVKNWDEGDWGYVAGICRWIEKNCKVKRRDPNIYRSHALSMGHGAWRVFEGHCGHQHVPGQSHWDPSQHWRKDLVIGHDPCEWDGEFLKHGSKGKDVERVQRWLNDMVDSVFNDRKHSHDFRERGHIVLEPDGEFGKSTGQRVRQFQYNHDLESDGIVGPMTWRRLCVAARKEG